MNLSKREIANLVEAVSKAVTDTLIPAIERTQKKETSCSNHMAPWTNTEMNALKFDLRCFIYQQAQIHKRTNLSIAHKLRSILSEPF